ncbi:M14 family zinc carboxypeptidase [Micromonospora sp. NPDC048999]|uniref:M14 family zinc carboxypeptidase n=1 Tax=Micromonospora sp. NPDC048999 TaxID=3155391 RepID=UPI0033F197B2
MRSIRRPGNVGRLGALLAVPLAIALTALPTIASPSSPDGQVKPLLESSSEQNGVALMRIVAADRAEVDRLADLGVDLVEYVKPLDEGIEVHAVLSPEETNSLRAMGFNVQGKIADQDDYAENTAERQEAIAAAESAAAAEDTLTVLRAEWFTSLNGNRFLSFEVKSSAVDSATVLTARWDSGVNTAAGSGGTATMSRFTDAGQYMYHRFTSPLALNSPVPDKVVFTSNKGGTKKAAVSKWLGKNQPEPGEHYVADFVDHYMDPTEITNRITALSQEFPKLTQLIDLPYKTNGYRRKAQAQFGTVAASTLYVTSKAWGHEGGNDITMSVVNPGGANQPLGVSVTDNNVVVSLATNGSGAVTSTAAQAVAAVNGNAAASALLTASLYRGNAGTGVVATAGLTKLTDYLKAPASVSRDPFQMKMLRIGRAKDGSKPGVYLYCQQHAREWVTPITCLETAERLLRNYEQDAKTRNLVNGLDIFILPVTNPDGAHYSMYDYNMQRRNMTNHCAVSASDPAYRNSWGVDLNRNQDVGSLFDGYSGASSSCTSDTYAGPGKISEPEAKNEDWIIRQFPNIKFSMNTHSYGGYFMWAPGAYKTAGREVLPRPDFGTENYFWEASEKVLSGVQSWRGTAIWPGRTGPIADVLYSAAGNSSDAHWYNRGIIGWSFEVGADLYNPNTRTWQAVGFQPNFAEGHEEAMEFSSGQIAILDVAKKFAADKTPPVSELLVKSKAPGVTTFTFKVNEASNIYYTLDGSTPTTSSRKLASNAYREGAEHITINAKTTVKWFAVDFAGNVESVQERELNVPKS